MLTRLITQRARLDSPALSSTSLSHSPSPARWGTGIQYWTLGINKLYSFSISPPPKDNENSNSSSADNMDNMEYGDLEMNLEFDCRWRVPNLLVEWKIIAIASCCVCKSIVQESGNSLMECNTCQNLYHQVSLIKNMFPSLAFLNSAFRCATILQSAMKKPKTPGWSGTVWNAQSEYWKRTTHNLILTHDPVSGSRKLRELRNWNSPKQKSLGKVPPLQCWPAAVLAWSSQAPRPGSPR